MVIDVGRVCPRRWPFFDAALRAPSRARECPRFDVDRLGRRSCLLLASATFSRNCDAAFNSRDDLTAVTWTLRQRNAEISQLNLMHKGNAMPDTSKSSWRSQYRALCQQCVPSASRYECDAQCVEGHRRVCGDAGRYSWYLVVGTIRLVGSNANNAFSAVASSIQ